MKKIFSFLFAGVLMCALCGACDKHDIEIDGHDPEANCFVFVDTTPDKETILLAKSGLSFDEALTIFEDLKSEYGNNVMWSVTYPGSINNIELEIVEIAPDAISNCYEITMNIDFSDTEVPPRESLLNYGFRGVRFNGTTAICKKYLWAYTDRGANLCVEWVEKSYNSYGSKWGITTGGTIIGTPVFKKLGSELHNVPIEF